MRHWAILLTGILLLTVAAAGCSNQSFAFNKVEAAEKVPETILNAIDELKLDRGYYVFDSKQYGTGKTTYVLICGGEKRTGGYDIEVVSKKVKNGQLQVTVKEIEPKQGSMVIQVLTYPYVLFKTDADFKTIKITNAEDYEFLPLEIE